ncbi:MAG: hypothetical protein K2K98_12740 [Muribaculaceae bacterium]|nr:hypothetical protein [Muribaculaceae bacterium]
MNTNDNEATQFQQTNSEKTIFDNDSTAYNSEDTTYETDQAAYTEESASADQPQASDSTGKFGWKQVAVGGTTGILLGTAATFLMGMKKADDPIEPDKDGKVDDNATEATQPAWADGDIAVATGVNDDMSFNEAFAAARAEVGPGGAFEWHGNVYGTYYANEWNAMSPQERNEFGSHFSWNEHSSASDTHYASTGRSGSHHTDHTAHHTTTNSEHTSSTHTTAQTTEGNDDIEVISVDRPGTHTQTITAQEQPVVTDDMDIEVLGVTYDADNDITLGELNVGGHAAVVIDIDGDQTFDLLAVDLNDDGQPQVNEQAYIGDAGLTVNDLGGVTAVIGGQPSLDGMPDPGATDMAGIDNNDTIDYTADFAG